MSVGVTAVGGGVGQAVLQSMNHSRLQWRTVGMDTRPLAPGLYWCDERYLISPVAQEEAYIQDLLGIVEREHLELLIPGLDVELEPLARHRGEFEERGCNVIVAAEEAVRLAHDKFALCEFCRQRHLPFVPTYTVEEAQRSVDTEDLPVIAKPRKGKASTGVRLVHSHEELQELPRDRGLIVQHYLPPPSQESPAGSPPESLNQSDEWSVQFFVDGNGDILGHFVSVNELKEGFPWEIVPQPNRTAVEEARAIVGALIEKGFYGPINIQGRETEEGFQFFEANTRFTGITGVRASMGYRELDAAVHALLLEDPDEARACLDFDTDFVATRHVEHTTLPKERVITEQSSSRAETNGKAISVPGASLGTVLVTGATGYIGTTLIQNLLEASETQAVCAGVQNREQGNQLQSSLGHPEKLYIETGQLPTQPWRLEGIDSVVHLAAARPTTGEGATETSAFFEVNAEGTRRLLESALQNDVRRFVFVSSQSVYGTQRRPPWTELMTPQPETPYGLSKWIGEQLCSTIAASHMDTIALRVARVFGTGTNMRWENFPHNLARDIHQGGTLEIYGDGRQRMDLVHVQDVCRAIREACVTTLPPGHYAVNIGGGNPISVRDLVSIFRQNAVRMGLPESRVEHRKDQDEQWADFGMDIRRAMAHLDWRPSVSPAEAVRELLQAYPTTVS